MSKKDLKRKIWKKTNGVCAHCGRAVSDCNRTIDHYVPKSFGGSFDQRNLVPLCRECNWERGNKIVEPKSYYKFAPMEVIFSCRSYERKWKRENCSMFEMATT